MHTPETCVALGCATDPNRSQWHTVADGVPAIAPGTRVAVPAMRGDSPVSLFGTVVPSRFRRWVVVRLDNGRGHEWTVRADSVTVLGGAS